MTQRIHLTMVGGLCNRLRALTAALHVCKRLDLSLSIDWGDLDKSCPCAIEDLFVEGYRALEDSDEEEVTKLEKWKWGGVEPGAFYHAFLPGTDLEEFKSGCLAQMKGLVPVPAIMRRLDSIKGKLGPNTVGIHMRRTDVMIWDGKRHRPIDVTRSDHQLIERLDLESPDTQFFLAADNPDSVDLLKSRYGDRILHSDATWKQGELRLTEIEDAVVDLYCLASCSRIVGTYWSSFTDYAATLGGIPAERIGVPIY